MKTVHLWENALEETHSTHEVEDVRDFLLARFKTWPETARIYHGGVGQDCDVTPNDVAGISRLGDLPGPFLVVVYPGDPTGGILTVAIVVAVASLAMSFLYRPQIPNLGRLKPGSANNDLSDRQNQARVNGRIPDILGTVRSTPDLLSAPYTMYESHQAVEHAFMCVGRGEYDVPADSIREGETQVEDIFGNTVEVYKPRTSPNYAPGGPQLRIGSPITAPFLAAKHFQTVNGQVLRPPNRTAWGNTSAPTYATHTYTATGTWDTFPQTITLPETPREVTEVRLIAGAESQAVLTPFEHYTGSGSTITITSLPFTTSGDIRITYTVDELEVTTGYVHFEAPNAIVKDEDGTDFTDLFQPYDPLTISGAVTGDFNLDGTYSVLAVERNAIYLQNPASVNAAWTTWVAAHSPTETVGVGLVADGPRWVGPFVLDVGDTNHVLANFVAPGGIYNIGKYSEQWKRDVTVALEITAINAGDDNPRPGVDPVTIQGTIEGSGTVRTLRALSMLESLSFTGRCKVRACRVSTREEHWEGTIVDEVRWDDVYAMSPITASDFGDVTTVRTATRANVSSAAVRSRKLNMLVTRKLPTWNGSSFSASWQQLGDGSWSLVGTLAATNNAADILCHVCLDPKIGNRPIEEIDVAGIYSTVAAVQGYFGTAAAASFNATLDKDNLSFEETAAMIAGAVFCTAYRRGSVIKLSFEKATTDSTLLFNHRNKLPGSENRTFSFGNAEGNDGVELEYVDPADDSVQTFYLPEDRSALNPKKIETVGIRGRLQAYFHANRALNRILYQRVGTEFEATQEADLLVLNDRILVADNTRPAVQPKVGDGQVENAAGLVLTLSRPVTFVGGKTYTIFLQLPDGTVEAMPVTAGSDAYHVTLSRAPRVALTIDPETTVQGALWWIVADDDPREQAFLVTEREAGDRMTSTVRAVNYDARYYAADQDYATGAVDANGYPV